MTEVQHTIKVRTPFKDETGRDVSRIIDVHCPPFTPTPTLDAWLAQYKATNPKAVIVSKSW